jgi:hypothetical protein
VGKEHLTGSVEIDMAPLVAKGEVYLSFPLQGQTVTQNATINVFFAIYPSDEQVRRASEFSLHGSSAKSAIVEQPGSAQVNSILPQVDALKSNPRFQSMARPPLAWLEL